jgi:hypothetical protein
VWWLDETATIQHGYLHDKTATSGYDDVDTAGGLLRWHTKPASTQCTDISAKIESLKLRPSKEATYSVLTWGAREAPRDRTRVVMGSAEVWHYPWLEGARGI